MPQDSAAPERSELVRVINDGNTRLKVDAKLQGTTNVVVESRAWDYLLTDNVTVETLKDLGRPGQNWEAVCMVGNKLLLKKPY